jgi:hypothetical protein
MHVSRVIRHAITQLREAAAIAAPRRLSGVNDARVTHSSS